MPIAISWLFHPALGFGVVVAAALMGQADDAKPSAAVLTDLGLTAEKARYVYAADEKALHEKYRDARAAVEQARAAQAKVQDGEMMEQGVAALQSDEMALREEIGSMRAGASGTNYGSGRRGGNYSRNQTNAMIRREEAALNQVRAQIKQATRQKLTPKQKDLAALGARQAFEQAERAVKDVVTAHEALADRYDQARSKPGVLKALEDVGRAKKMGFRLGPSEESEKIGAWAKALLKIRPKKATARPAHAPDAAAKPADDTSPKNEGKTRP
ncbi:hypothetical protein [Paludisphaera mucosa]|uniref:Chromosome partition protein Smc n=1 Tax=Paludisphaera mucosa TaxID=3030827 RepID=A0ABT6F646_9BACT|nr:hypothetical protein [Paludisphaera mucosa]MDG3002893.1 hypothetical protein [Paludisphaera mucosa]